MIKSQFAHRSPSYVRREWDNKLTHNTTEDMQFSQPLPLIATPPTHLFSDFFQPPPRLLPLSSIPEWRVKRRKGYENY